MSGARMEQAWLVLVQGRKEGESTLDVSEVPESRQPAAMLANCGKDERVAVGSNVWKMHDMAAGGAKNLRKGKLRDGELNRDREETAR